MPTAIPQTAIDNWVISATRFQKTCDFLSSSQTLIIVKPETIITYNVCDNHLPQWWVEFVDELRWLFTNKLSATRYMKVMRMGITEILRRIWLFSANKIKSSESFSKQPTQLIVKLNSSLQHIIVTLACIKITLQKLCWICRN